MTASLRVDPLAPDAGPPTSPPFFRQPRNGDVATAIPSTIVGIAGQLMRSASISLIVGSIAGIGWMVLQAITPWLIGHAFDALRAGHSARLWHWSAWLSVTALTLTALGAVRHYMAVLNWLTGAHTMRWWVGRKTSQLGAHTTAHVTPGSAAALASQDGHRIGDLADIVGRAVGSVVSVIVVAVLCFSTSLRMGLLVFAGVVITLAAVTWLTKPMAHRSTGYRQANNDMISISADGIAGLRVLRGVGGERAFLRRYEALSRSVVQQGRRVAALNGWQQGLQLALPGVLLCTVALAGAVEVADGRMTPGQLLAFVGYTQFLAMPLRYFSEVSVKYARAQVAVRKLAEFFAHPDAEHQLGGSRQDPLPVADLNDPTSGVTVRVGRFTALVSAMPELAAAIAHRIGRVGELASAHDSASIGSIPLSQWRLSAVREHICFVDSLPELMKGTLRSQLDPLGQHSDESLLRVVDITACHDVLDSLPGGFDDHVTEQGRSLSGGQRQRVSLARALLTNRPVMVLVEPTSAVDAHTEATVARNLAYLRTGLTTLIVSTSPLVLQQADDVVFVDEDGSLATGTHHELASGAAQSNDRYRNVVLRDQSEDGSERRA